METQVRTPQMVFMQPQRLVVPLFQRPYVWNQENQWEPLWNDVVRVAERLLANPADKHHPHFLGAVVLQQVQKQTGQLQERTIIDGQQRLTTLQLLLDALQAELAGAEAQQPAMRLEPLVENAAAFCAKAEDRFKVWPTNRDRAGFNAVMSAPTPVDYAAVGHRGHRMVEAHRFFSEQAREWLGARGEAEVAARAAAIETSVRELLQVVVIDLAVDENAQEIFETLNARGAQLTSADLIKNFIFQRLLEADCDVEAAYQRHWKDFETGFWEAEISAGRQRYPRSAAFLNHWLVARTGEEVLAREVFERFKRFVDHEARLPMEELLGQLHRAAGVYREFIEAAATGEGELGLFGYRTGVLESEVIKPVILCLLDPEAPEVPAEQIAIALRALESWLVRRMLVRVTAKNYNQVVAELVARIRSGDRERAGETVERYLREQAAASRYWPDDMEVRREVSHLAAYRRLSRTRLRMVLEAIEDHRRGWKPGETGLGGQRVPRGKLAIEHVMPVKWATHWVLCEGTEEERDRRIHTLGNLTLLTGRLNSKVSNGPWDTKRDALDDHDVLLLNRELLKDGGAEWTDAGIEERTQRMIDALLEIWPVPDGHRSVVKPEGPTVHKTVTISDLLAAGMLEPGQILYPRIARFRERTATVLPDGDVEVDGVACSSASEAGTLLSGKRRNGWYFFLVDPDKRRSLRDVRDDYIAALFVDAEEEDEGEDEEGDEERDA